MEQSNLIKTLCPVDNHVEQISPPAERALSDQIQDSLDEKEKPDHASASDAERPVYVRGWRLRLLSLGLALTIYPSTVADH